MSELIINTPEPGSGVYNLSLAGQDLRRIVFAADLTGILLKRQGDDLVLLFDNGSEYHLKNYYTLFDLYTSPAFVLYDTTISARDFFGAFGGELMPGLGPVTRQLSDSAHFQPQGDMELLGGLEKSSGLSERTANEGPAAPNHNSGDFLAQNANFLGWVRNAGQAGGVSAASPAPDAADDLPGSSDGKNPPAGPKPEQGAVGGEDLGEDRRDASEPDTDQGGHGKEIDPFPQPGQIPDGPAQGGTIQIGNLGVQGVIHVKGVASLSVGVSSAHTEGVLLTGGTLLAHGSAAIAQDPQYTRESSDDFFARFFQDALGQGMGRELVLASGTLILELDRGLSAMEMLALINQYAAVAAADGQILYVSGEAGSRLDFGWTEGLAQIGQANSAIILNGNFSAWGELNISGMLYVDGILSASGQVQVDGLLAVSEHFFASAQIMAETGGENGVFGTFGSASQDPLTGLFASAGVDDDALAYWLDNLDDIQVELSVHMNGLESDFDLADVLPGAVRRHSAAADDLLVYDATDTVVDGGDGIDFMLGVQRDAQGYTPEENQQARNIEVLVFESASLGLLDMRSVEELGLYGITRGAGDSGLQFGSGWQTVDFPPASADGAQYVEMQNKDLNLDVLVQRFLLGG